MRRQSLEAALLIATSCRLAYGVVSASSGAYMDAVLLAAVSLVAVTQELQGISGPAYATRTADSEGVALGALALPWAFTGLLATCLRHEPAGSGFAADALRASTASSAAMLAWLSVRQQAPSWIRSNKSNTAPHSIQALAAPILSRAAPLCKGAESRKDPGRAARRPSRNQVGGVLLVASLALVALPIAVPVWQGVGAWGSPEGLAWGRPPANGTLSALGAAVNATAGAGGMHLVLTRLPGCFTLGEAMVVTQAACLLAWDVATLVASCLVAYFVFPASPALVSQEGGCFWGNLLQRAGLQGRPRHGLFVELLLFSALAIGAVAAALLRSINVQPTYPDRGAGSRRLFEHLLRPAGIALGCILIFAAALAARPAFWAIGFAFETRRRAGLMAYWAFVLGAALPLMDWLSRWRKVPTIIVRKGYHVLALVLFAPALLLEPHLLQVSLAVAAAALIAAEVLRVGAVPGLGPRINTFMTSFIDSRDSGLLLVSHFSLLAGMAAPVWLSPASVGNGVESPFLLPAFAGIVILGVADSAASAVGRRFGRHRVLGTHKTVEGTLGGVLCTLGAWALLQPLCGFLQGWAPTAALATLGSCLLEASTTQLDNIFLPLHHFALLSL